MSSDLLALVLPTPGCCGHLQERTSGSEIPVSYSAFQINRNKINKSEREKVGEEGTPYYTCCHSIGLLMKPAFEPRYGTVYSLFNIAKGCLAVFHGCWSAY